MQPTVSRRTLLAGSMLAATGVALATPTASAESPSAEPFRYCFNTSTIRAQKLPLPEIIDLIADAGYSGIEPWIAEIDAYVQQGGSLSDLRKRIADRGLTVESAIGFAQWIVDDDAARAKGLEEARRTMDLVAAIGGRRIAAPPSGATRERIDNLLVIAERYRALLEIGRQAGVVPQLEIWGHSQTLNRLGESTFVAIEASHPDACLLPDVYHIFRGGSDFAGLGLLGASAIHVFHVNDYPSHPPREQMKDADRVYPGDGVAPLDDIFRTLHRIGFRGALSLELFNPTYWQQDPRTVIHTGLQKTRTAITHALG